MVWVIAVFTVLVLSGQEAVAQDDEDQFTTNFMIEDCRFTTIGTNPYFILLPGYQLVLEGEDEEETIRVQITVLHKIQKLIVPGLGMVLTRVVEEREWADGELVEVSNNFFAICRKTNSVFYFGEDVDIYEDGEIVSHEGAWRAGVNGAMPGIIMPGTFLLGSRYFQEIAPGVAMDRGENVEMGLEMETEAGLFCGCVKVLETTPLEPDAESEKIYCPGIGLVVDDEVELIEYGFVHSKSPKNIFNSIFRSNDK
jgi:hypothetical protein